MPDRPLAEEGGDLVGAVPPVPLVTIGVPTYNRSATLERALVSVLRQDYPAIEVIVSDNASTDATAEVCQRLASQDRRVRYIRQPVNRGPTANFVEVLHQAHGEYFMWLGDDDWLPDSSWVSECLSFLGAHPDHSLVCGIARYFKGGHEFMGGTRLQLPQESPLERVRAYYRVVDDNGTFYGLARRALLLEIGVTPALGGDWLLVAAIAFRGKIRTLGHISICRDHNWDERSYAKVVAIEGLTSISARFPFASIGFSAFREIVWRSLIYRNIPFLQRVLLGLQCQTIIVLRHGWPRAYRRLRAAAVGIVPHPVRTRLQRALGRLRGDPDDDLGTGSGAAGRR